MRRLKQEAQAILSSIFPAAPDQNDPETLSNPLPNMLPESTLPRLGLSQAARLAREGNYEAAEALLAPMTGPQADASACHLLAQIRAQRGDLPAAARLWRAVLKTDPGHPGALAGMRQIQSGTPMLSPPWLLLGFMVLACVIVAAFATVGSSVRRLHSSQEAAASSAKARLAQLEAQLHTMEQAAAKISSGLQAQVKAMAGQSTAADQREREAADWRLEVRSKLQALEPLPVMMKGAAEAPKMLKALADSQENLQTQVAELKALQQRTTEQWNESRLQLRNSQASLDAMQKRLADLAEQISRMAPSPAKAPPAGTGDTGETPGPTPAPASGPEEKPVPAPK